MDNLIPEKTQTRTFTVSVVLKLKIVEEINEHAYQTAKFK